MPKELILLSYVILCTIVGIFGRNKTIGFWGFFFFAAILTPLIGFALLVIAKDRDASLV